MSEPQTVLRIENSRQIKKIWYIAIKRCDPGPASESSFRARPNLESTVEQFRSALRDCGLIPDFQI